MTFQTDDASCGGCGHACEATQLCVNGACHLRNVSFASSTVYDDSANPLNTVLLANVGDLNEDGHLDLVLGINGAVENKSVAIMLGKGDGTFEPPNFLDFTALAAPLGVEDLDADGHLDLLVTDASILSGPADAPATLIVLWGTGKATFNDSSSLPLGHPDTGCSVTDVNKDGRLDILSTSGPGGMSSYLINEGGRTFSNHSFPLTISNYYWSGSGDLNSDGEQDLVFSTLDDAAGTTGATKVWLGQQDGTFGDGNPVDGLGQSFAHGPVVLLVTDVDGNKHDDIIAANQGSATLDILLTGSDSRTITPSISIPVGSKPGVMAMADVNGDGVPDLIVHDESIAMVNVLLGKGGGAFAEPLPLTAPTAEYSGMTSVDFNGDGKNDLLLFSLYKNEVFVMLNTTAN